MADLVVEDLEEVEEEVGKVIYNMKIHNKLVRDNVPEILDSKQVVYDMRVLSGLEYEEALKAKIMEEAAECAEASGGALLEECADVLEVLYAIVEHEGMSMQDIETLRIQKKKSAADLRKRFF